MKQILSYNNGETLSYAEYGNRDGFPIVIQHGMVASIADYHLFDRLLRLNTRLICIARPGYGGSSPAPMKNIGEWAEIVSVLIDHLALTIFDVLGMSSGAPYSYALGHAFPDQIRNIFIYSGIPALYDENILARWPYEVTRNANMEQMETLAYDLFFSKLPEADRQKDDVKDSMMNHCFGVAQDLKLRSSDWGFYLQNVPERVFMRHSLEDESVPVITAAMTAALLPNCKLDIKAGAEHFSSQALDDFIRTVMADFYDPAP